MAWDTIVTKVNTEVGQTKTKFQVKKKISNLKQEYKAMKLNNSRSGRGRKTSRFFEKIDSVLGTRDVITMPAVCTAGSSEGVRSGDDENSPPNVGPIPPKKRRDINDTLLAIQERQDETMERFVSYMEQMEEKANERFNALQESTNRVIDALLQTINN